MEEIKSILKSMQEAINQQKRDMQDMKEDIKETINRSINEKFRELENQNKILEEKLEVQISKLNTLERNSRRKNLLIFGIEENEQGYWDLEKSVVGIIDKYLDIKCDKNSIEYIRRLGKKGEKTRPIVITLATMGLKIKILKQKKKFESTPYYVKEDFPLEILNKRKELQKEVNTEREKGRLAILKYDKIIFLNNKNTDPERSRPGKKKRNLSSSPESIEENRNTNILRKAAKKVNKNNHIEKYLTKAINSKRPSLEEATISLNIAE
ncbi:uncharacterized protein LOC125056280 [Pieris napi]|uniref:uncharacterized protein LOC125056280 n=1 Tax=Pieris napi TaxID=78633 RepID=UPI001FBB7066|nr:uncharacterized protein LOC125056280 [Pieris napi]